MGVKFLYGNLLEIKDVDAIIHQVNCLCTKAHGLSQQIAEKFPWGDIYSKRRTESRKNLAVIQDRGTPGMIEVFKSPQGLNPDIVCFLSQWDFGSTKQNYRTIPPYRDTNKNRLKWFRQCLEQLETLNIKSIGVPYQIGCGLGSGEWMLYLHAIEDFAEKSSIDINIVIPSFIKR